MRVHRAPLHSYMLREGLKDQRPRRAVEHKPGGSRKERSGAEDRLLQLAVAYDEENHPHRACARPAPGCSTFCTGSLVLFLRTASCCTLGVGRHVWFDTPEFHRCNFEY